MPIYHVAAFTESKILDILGAGEETVTRIEGQTSMSKDQQANDVPCEYVNMLRTKTILEATIFWDKPTKLQTIFDTVHQIFPLGFTINHMSIRREASIKTNYNLLETIDRVFRFETFGFKPGTFKRYRAEVIPAEALQNKFKKFKQRLRNQIEPAIYRKIKDTILMNYNPYSIKELRDLFFKTSYFFLIEEHDGKFIMSDFGEI